MQDSLVSFTQMLLDAAFSVLELSGEMEWGKNLIHSQFK